MSENSLGLCHMLVMTYLLLCLPGVYVPAGAGIGPGGTGTGTGFFPGNRVSNDCLDSLNKNNPERGHNKQSLFMISRGITVKLYCGPELLFFNKTLKNILM